MILSLEQIKKTAVGYAEIWEEDSLVKFSKATKKQLSVWLSSGYGTSAPTTTGVRLDFHSNTLNFSFTAIGKDFRYEILIDGKSFFYTRLPEQVHTISVKLDGKEHRITLLLPFHAQGAIKDVTIDNGASFYPHKFDCKIMFWGDSITQGWQSSKDSLAYPFIVSQHFNAESVVLGNGGTFFIPETVVEDYPFNPDIIVIAYGTNDWGIAPSLSQIKDNCKKFLENINTFFKGSSIVGITPIWRVDINNPRPNGTFEELIKILKEEYLSHGAYVVDGLTLLPHDSKLLTDSVHPNDQGFDYYSKNLIPHLSKLLKI